MGAFRYSIRKLTRKEFQPLICRAKMSWLARMFFKKALTYTQAGAPAQDPRPLFRQLYRRGPDQALSQCAARPRRHRGLSGRRPGHDERSVRDGPCNFTHIWYQRNFSTRQYSFLKSHRSRAGHLRPGRSVDVRSCFRSFHQTKHVGEIQWGLRRAKAVTVASETLKHHVNEDAGSIAGETLVLKNGCIQATLPDRSTDRKQLIWTSIDVPFFLRENPTFIKGLANVLRRTNYELILVGRFDR